jgi:hypothetical protein
MRISCESCIRMLIACGVLEFVDQAWMEDMGMAEGLDMGERLLGCFPHTSASPTSSGLEIYRTSRITIQTRIIGLVGTSRYFMVKKYRFILQMCIHSSSVTEC